MSVQNEIQNIEARLSAAGKSVADLCHNAGLARSTWQRWKSGANSPQFRTWEIVTAACEDICAARVEGIPAGEPQNEDIPAGEKTGDAA